MLWAGLVMAVLALGGTGCATGPAGPDIPANAIAIGDDLYMVPLPDRIGGCRVYRQASRTRTVTAALYYRGRDGGFVLDRSQAICE